MSYDWMITAWLLVVGTFLSAWVTHVVVCIKAGAWLLLIAGALVAPVGVIHGIATWFGAMWV